jgi:hypothetical protein
MRKNAAQDQELVLKNPTSGKNLLLKATTAFNKTVYINKSTNILKDYSIIYV